MPAFLGLRLRVRASEEAGTFKLHDYRDHVKLVANKSLTAILT